MKLRFVVKNHTDGRTNGDIEALADARQVLEKSTILTIKDIFLCQKLTEFFSFFSLKNIEKGEQLLCHILIILISNVVEGPIFNLQF